MIAFLTKKLHSFNSFAPYQAIQFSYLFSCLPTQQVRTTEQTL
nr:MAG TPA: hypothetical protein [Caudoviricetes sp.]